MRVEAVGEMPKRTGVASAVREDAAPGSAIKNFVAAIDSDDSLFCIAQPLVGPSADESTNGVCFGDIVVEFRGDELTSQRKVHFVLIEKLIELLKEAGSSESLETTLCLTSRSIVVGAPADTSGRQVRANRQELALWMRLAAKGVSPEQAVLRWGLGLAQLQQALMFASRHLRQHIAQIGG